jgi:hypothetical protein
MSKRHRRPNQTRNETRQLQREIEKPGGTAHIAGECSAELARRFLEHVLAFESEEGRSLHDRLIEGGMSLPNPEALSDAALHDKLWEVISALALLGAYLYSTDHLSDRELYSHLWHQTLREPTVLMPHDPAFATHIDLVGSGSEEDIAIYLRYYADEQTRQDWAREFPDVTVPPHGQPPYDRDRLLPRRDWCGEA